MRHYITTTLLTASILLSISAKCHGSEYATMAPLTQNTEKTLGEIREEIMSKWTYEDWMDNGYFRCIRNTLDEYLNGNRNLPGVSADTLDKYRDIISGQFVVGRVTDYIFGGLFITIIFVDEPTKAFSTWVYSFVDKKTETITGYEMRGFELDFEGNISPFKTKDEIITSAEHYGYKLF